MTITAATAYSKNNNGATPDGEVAITHSTEAEARSEVRRAFTEFYGYKPVRVNRTVKGGGLKFEAVGPVDEFYGKDVMFLWV